LQSFERGGTAECKLPAERLLSIGEQLATPAKLLLHSTFYPRVFPRSWPGRWHFENPFFDQ
jgi:hypothetical protein